MMNILKRIEQRVALPGDDETVRTRKKLAIFFLFDSFIALTVCAFVLARSRLADSTWQFAIFSLYTLISCVLLLVIPKSYDVVVRLFLLAVILFNLLVQITFGGYSSGVYSMPWAMLGPLGAVMFFEVGFTVVSVIVFGMSLIVIAFVEPAAMAAAPEITTTALISINTASLAILCLMVALSSLYLLQQVEHYRQRANDLLLNILPGSIAARLKESPNTIADGFDEVSVLFADIVNFTDMSSNAAPVEVVNMLNIVFSEFDDLAKKYGLEKIKTIGDAYMVAAGLPEPRVDHVEAIARFAIDMLDAVERCEGLRGEPVHLRVGINTGPVVAGVIGHQKFIYDLWGDAVNVASRMESNGLTNQIQVTQAVKDKLEGKYTFSEREPIYIKGKGNMVTYLLEP
jgi:class 3 adenylate cyclase